MKLLSIILTTAWLYACTGCMSASKATGYLDKNRKIAADYCAAVFPPKTTTDTKAYDSTTAIIDSLVNEYNSLRGATDEDRQQLIEQIRQLSYSRPECDTIVKTVNKIIYRDKVVDKAADKAVEAAKNVAPVINNQVNTAEVEALRLRFNECADAGLQLSRDNEDLRDRMKGKWMIPWWIVVAVIAYHGISLWRRSLNPLKWIA